MMKSPTLSEGKSILLSRLPRSQLWPASDSFSASSSLLPLEAHTSGPPLTDGVAASDYYSSQALEDENLTHSSYSSHEQSLNSNRSCSVDNLFENLQEIDDDYSLNYVMSLGIRYCSMLKSKVDEGTNTRASVQRKSHDQLTMPSNRGLSSYNGKRNGGRTEGSMGGEGKHVAYPREFFKHQTASSYPGISSSSKSKISKTKTISKSVSVYHEIAKFVRCAEHKPSQEMTRQGFHLKDYRLKEYFGRREQNYKNSNFLVSQTQQYLLNSSAEPSVLSNKNFQFHANYNFSSYIFKEEKGTPCCQSSNPPLLHDLVETIDGYSEEFVSPRSFSFIENTNPIDHFSPSLIHEFVDDTIIGSETNRASYGLNYVEQKTLENIAVGVNSTVESLVKIPTANFKEENEMIEENDEDVLAYIYEAG